MRRASIWSDGGTPQRPWGTAGFTLLELLLSIGIGVAITTISIPLTNRIVDEIRAAGAARYVAARIMRIRLEAVRQSRAVALRFVKEGDDYVYTAYADGNGNGIRTADIQAGIDQPLGPPERIGDTFPGVRFVLDVGLPDVDGAKSTDPDGVRIGQAGILTMARDGTATSGTLYVRGRGGQYAVRVLGATGRTRVLMFAMGAATWRDQ
jgi:type II secretory pathway pseudopilin PulG